MANKPYIKYLNGRTGEYDFATVIDIGDLDKLKTIAKGNIVQAINSLADNGFELSDTLQNAVNDIDSQIDEIVKNSIGEAEIQEIENKILETYNLISEEMDKAIKELEGDYNEKFESASTEYNTRIGEVREDLNNATSELDSTRQNLADVERDLNQAKLNQSDFELTIDEINNILSSKINETTFELLESTVSSHGTLIEQNSEDISLKASQEQLNLTTGRVTDAEAAINVNANSIEQSVRRDELRREIDDLGHHSPNLLRDTRFWDSWNFINGSWVYKTGETYQHTDVVQFDGADGSVEKHVDDLHPGYTYTLSLWAKSESSNSQIRATIGSEQHILENISTGDSYIGSSWQRYKLTLVSPNDSFNVRLTISGATRGELSSVAGAKIEEGSEITGWRDHEDDQIEKLIQAETNIKQNADSIISTAERLEEAEGEITAQGTQLSQTAEAISALSSRIEETEEGIESVNSELSVQADQISSKVEQTHIDNTISDLNLDVRNYIRNSDFSDENEFNFWSAVSPEWDIIEDTDGKTWVQSVRSGLSNNLIIDLASNMFPVSMGDTLTIGLDILTSGLDNQTVLIVDLFDTNDTRLDFKAYTIQEFSGNYRNETPSRIHTRYSIDRQDVDKARVRLAHYKNGLLQVTNVSVQKGDISSHGWNTAPEDSQYIQARLRTSIDQKADSIELTALDSKLDQSTGDLSESIATLEITAGNITSRVEEVEKFDDRISSNTSSIEQTAEAITTKVTATDVEGIIDGKGLATQSYVEQTADSITSAVSSRVDNLEREVEETRYTWVMWADDQYGSGISEDSDGKTYMGVAHNKPTIDGSLNPDDYTWKRVQGNEGKDGINAVTGYLTNESILVSADSDGNVEDYSSAKGKFTVLDGASEVEDGVLYYISDENGIEIEIDEDTGEYQVIDVHGNFGTATLKAAYGQSVIFKTVIVTKAKQGFSGVDSTVYKIQKSSPVIIETKEGTYMPPVLNFDSTSLTGFGDYESFKGYFAVYERSSTAITIDEYTMLYDEGRILEDKEYLLSDKETPYVLRYISSFAESRKDYVPNGDIISIHVEVFRDKERTKLLDSETVMVAKDGIDGEDSYRVEVLSTEGNIFKNGKIETTLFARVYKGSEDITDSLNSSHFRWRRSSDDKEGDQEWNRDNATGVKEVTINTGDVYIRASFSCEIVNL